MKQSQKNYTETVLDGQRFYRVSVNIQFTWVVPNAHGTIGNLKPPFRLDVLLISFALLVLAICLAVISVSVRFICEKLDLIQREGQAGPLYSTHWVAAEVHVRGKRSRSPSPPPTYDTGQSRSPCKSWRRTSADLVEEATV
ncbi:hypothetical protein ANCCAN_22359 [Ancylostoma caninum]|uniref:Uncharacterized protein n=1 Tax=Ancylostoma caninum TaxID=29170 RepID=A0A368FLX6_ANCCA|nr:hypothetical protein ANCCAN_22359 [Ancylostoma caninum]